MTCTGMSYTAILLSLLIYASYTWYEVRRCEFDYCCIGRLNVVTCRGSISCTCSPATHIHPDYWHKGESLEHGCRCRCIAAALLLYTDFVAARLSSRFCEKNNTACVDRLVRP